MTDLEEFVLWCGNEGIVLTPLQLVFARTVLESDGMRKFYMGGLGSGRTFVAEHVERFYDGKRRRS